MALKLFQLFSVSTLLVLILFSTISDAKSSSSSAFGFIDQLKGCHKGNNAKGIHQLKAYLKEFGYLNQTQDANNDDFDDTLESAIKTYQENYHITPTGTLDAATVSTMASPRCGVPDIVNGINYMKHPHNNNVHGSSSIHIVSHYSFFPGNPKWSKTLLLYTFLPNFPTAAIAPVERAFQKWDAATHFSFARAQANQNADLYVGFLRRDHGDGYPFDGRGGTLAHAFSPTDGRFHYDADESWSVGAVQNSFDLETVAIHEIGQLLGLGHSQVQDAIMYSCFLQLELDKLRICILTILKELGCCTIAKTDQN